jgi:hypothetical protein
LKQTLAITILFIILSGLKSFSQSHANLEFIENKGQWNDLVKFRGLTSSGAFYLEKNGTESFNITLLIWLISPPTFMQMIMVVPKKQLEQKCW